MSPRSPTMPYRLLADAVAFVHLGSILHVVPGGFLVLRWGRWAWMHGPSVLWAAVEILGWMCPLTPLETRLRARGGKLNIGRSMA